MMLLPIRDLRDLNDSIVTLAHLTAPLFAVARHAASGVRAATTPVEAPSSFWG